jgi:hypothetical protein
MCNSTSVCYMSVHTHHHNENNYLPFTAEKNSGVYKITVVSLWQHMGLTQVGQLWRKDDITWNISCNVDSQYPEDMTITAT